MSNMCNNCSHRLVCIYKVEGQTCMLKCNMFIEELPHTQPLQYLPVEFIINKFVEYEKRLTDLEKKEGNKND